MWESQNLNVGLVLASRSEVGKLPENVHCSTKAALDNKEMKVCGCVPMKF